MQLKCWGKDNIRGPRLLFCRFDLYASPQANDSVPADTSPQPWGGFSVMTWPQSNSDLYIFTFTFGILSHNLRAGFSFLSRRVQGFALWNVFIILQ